MFQTICMPDTQSYWQESSAVTKYLFLNNKPLVRILNTWSTLHMNSLMRSSSFQMSKVTHSSYVDGISSSWPAEITEWHCGTTCRGGGKNTWYQEVLLELSLKENDLIPYDYELHRCGSNNCYCYCYYYSQASEACSSSGRWSYFVDELYSELDNLLQYEADGRMKKVAKQMRRKRTWQFVHKKLLLFRRRGILKQKESTHKKGCFHF